MILSQPPRTITVQHQTEKDGEKHTFLFRYHEDRQEDALRHVGKMAMNSEIPFTWFDAAEVAQDMRNKYDDLQNTPPIPMNLAGFSFPRK